MYRKQTKHPAMKYQWVGGFGEGGEWWDKICQLTNLVVVVVVVVVVMRKDKSGWVGANYNETKTNHTVFFFFC
jgi:hypothetical protein